MSNTTSTTPGDSNTTSSSTTVTTTSSGPDRCVPIETIGAIAGGCSAAVLLLVLLGVLGYILIRRRRSKDKSRPLGQGAISSHPAKEVPQESAQNADVEAPYQQGAATLETDLLQPTYSNGYMLDKVSSNPDNHLSSVGHVGDPKRLISKTENAVIRSQKPELFHVVEETAGPYTSLGVQANNVMNPYNTFDEFGHLIHTSGKTSSNRQHISEAIPDNVSMRAAKSVEKSRSENMNKIVGVPFSNKDTDISRLNVYENAPSVVSLHVEAFNGETNKKKGKDKKKNKKGKRRNKKSGLESDHNIQSDFVLAGQHIQSEFDQDNQNVYKNDRIYNNH